MIKKILNNATLMSWASKFVGFGSLILVTPLYLKVYDDLEFSFWSAINIFITYAMLADSGFGSALVRVINYFRAGADSLPKNKKEYDKLDKIENKSPNYLQLSYLLSTSNVIYLVLALLSAVLTIIGVLFIWNIMTLANHRIDFWITYFLLIPLCAILILTVKWSSFMHGLNYVAVEARINTAFSTLRVISFTVMLIFRLPPVYLISYMLIASFLKYLFLKSFVLKWFSKNNVSLMKKWYFNKPIFNALWPQTWRLAGIFWGNFLVENGNSFLIAQIKDTGLMANFYLTTRIIQFARVFSQTSFYANLPTIYKLGAEKNLKTLKEKVSHYMFLAIVIMVSIYLFVIFFGNSTLEFLDKFNILSTDKRFLPTFFLIIMTVTLLLDMHSSFHASIYSSTNHIPFLLPSIISGAIIVGVGYFFALDAYGLIGLLVVRFLVQFSFNNWYAMYLSLRLLRWPLFKYVYELPTIGTKFIVTKTKNIIKKFDI
jgi:O-antigen/teichoic acid export membrane protein